MAIALQTINNINALGIGTSNVMELLNQAADMIKINFNLPVVDIYLMTEIRNEHTLPDLVRETAYQQLPQVTDLAMALPVLAQQKTLAVLYIHAKPTDVFIYEDVHIYYPIASQLRLIIQNTYLYEQMERAEEKTNQLERLSKAESAVSLAQNESQILEAFVLGVESSKKLVITLYYITVDEDNKPAMVVQIAVWREGKIYSQDSLPPRQYRIDKFILSNIWLEKPNEVLFIHNIYTDSRVDEKSYDVLTEIGICTMAFMPLYGGHRWQGLLTFSWFKEHEFSSTEQFILRSLQKSASAIVASRRAYVNTEAAQRETEKLYNASRLMNESEDLQEMVEAVAYGVSVPAVNRIIMMVFEYGSDDRVASMWVAANWHSGQGDPPPPSGTYYEEDALSDWSFLQTEEPSFLDSIADDELPMPPFVEQHDNAFAVLPLWGKVNQIGALFIETDRHHAFSEREVHVYLSLVPQMAIAVENEILLAQAQTMARREQLLREITGRVRGLTDANVIIQTAVRELGLMLNKRTFVRLGHKEKQP